MAPASCSLHDRSLGLKVFQRLSASPLELVGAAPLRSVEPRRQLSFWGPLGRTWPALAAELPSSPSPRGAGPRSTAHARPDAACLAGLPSAAPRAPPGLCVPCSHPRSALPGGRCGPTRPHALHTAGPGGLRVSPVDTASLPPLPAPWPSGVKLVLVHVHVTSHWPRPCPPPSGGPAVGVFPDLLLPPASIRPSGKVSSSVRTGPLAQRSLPSPPRHPDYSVLCKPEAAPWPEHVLPCVAERYGLCDLAVPLTSLRLAFFISKMGIITGPTLRTEAAHVRLDELSKQEALSVVIVSVIHASIG